MLTNKHKVEVHGIWTETDPMGLKPKQRTVGTCPCGREVTILFDDTACSCGRYYNLFGQELIPPDQRDPSADGDDDY